MAAGTGPLTTHFEHGVTIARPTVEPAPVSHLLADVAQSVGTAGQMFGPMIERGMVNAGKREGEDAADATARGEKPDLHYNAFERFIAPARFEAAQEAYTSRIRGEIDAREKEIRSKFAFDPDGYKAETGKMIDGFIASAPSDWAREVGGYARMQAREGGVAVAKARTERDQAENVAAVTAREASTRADALALAFDGKFLTGEYNAKVAEWRALNRGKAGNPLFKWSEAQAEIEEQKFEDELLGVLSQQKALSAYSQAGGGEAGKLAAMRSLEEDFGYRDPSQERRVAPRGSVSFQPPVQGRMTSAFGAARPNGAHGGVDIAVPVGTPVVVAAPGVVVGVGEDSESGKFVRVRHADGSITSYAHLSAFGVKRGDELAAGTVLGKSGNSGNSTGPHLHFKMRDPSGRVVDPTKTYGRDVELAGEAPTEQPPVDRPLLEGLAPGRRRKLYNDSLSYVRQISEADRQEARLEEQRTADARAERRALVAEYRLDYLLGNKPDWRSDERLDDAARVQLETAENAQEARDRAEARREAQAQKASAGASYDRLRKDAEDGVLDAEALADAVESGEIPRARAETLRTLNRKALKHDVAIVKSGAPAWYSKRPPGMPDKVWRERKAQFDDGVARWLPNNLDADDARKKQAGVNIGIAVYNPSGKATGAGDGSSSNSLVAERMRSLAAERSRTGMSDAEYQRRRRAISAEFGLADPPARR